jgi:16S rRNA (adenine1518-N6/adenine1519-N6)-dimethyltransferase
MNKKISHKAKKRFGQNFLTNDYYLYEIVKNINPQHSDNIIEIGPGLGALTKHLLDNLADSSKLKVIEIDTDCISELSRIFKSEIENNKLEIINIDVLKVDFPNLITSNNTRIIGNLPYNISSPLIIKLLPLISKLQDMVFLLQKEVVDRLAASPNNSSYGRLSIITQYFCDVTPLTHIPPDAFTPAPKVESKLVRLSPKKNKHNELKSITNLEKVTRIAFNQRRKQIKSSLKSLFTEQQLIDLNINPKLRPENLSIDEYIKLANSILI